MPMKEITIPSSVALVDPRTKKIIEEALPILFSDFIQRLLLNPIWMETYPNIKSANAVSKALDEAADSMKLADSDWEKLKSCVDNMKVTVTDAFGRSSVQQGIGYSPAATLQLQPFMDAIVAAKDAV